MADEVASLVLRIDSTQAKTASTDLDKLAASSSKAEKATEAVAAASAAATTAASSLGKAAQSASSGQSAMAETVKKLNVEMRSDASGRWSAGMSTMAQSATMARASIEALNKAAVTYSAQGGSLAGASREVQQVAAATGALAQQQKQLATSSTASAAAVQTSAAAAKALGTSAAAAGLTAGQLNNAMRMLPAQITDISVGLATGQSPFMVLAQQGGQLKDMFGGIGPAIRAVVGYVAGLITPISAVAAAVGALGFAYYRGSEETDRFRDAITLTGNAAGVTSGQLGVMAQAIGEVVGTTGRAADALAQLVEAGEFSGDVIERLATAALKMEEATGRSVEETVKAYRKIAEEPAKAIAELNRQQNFLAAGQYEQIRALERQGDKQEAARVALLAYSSATERSADIIVGRAGYIERAWDAVWRAVRRAGSELASLGRDTGLEGELAKAEDRLTQLQDAAYERGAANRVRQVQEQRAIVEEIRERVRMQQRLAANERQQGEIQRAAVEAQQEIEKARESSASQQAKLNKALKEYRDNIEAIRRADPNSAFLDPKKIAADEAALREQFKERGGNRGLSAAARMIQQAREQEASLRAQLDSAVKITSARQDLVQFEQRIADIKAKDQLTADEKSLLANEASLRSQLELNAELSDQIVLQKEAVQLRVAERSALETLAADQERYSGMLETFAAGPRLREQMEAQRELYRDFQRQTQRAAEQQAAGELTPQGYADRLRVLRQSLDDRLALQADYFERLRTMESDWQLGAAGGFADYADEASNVAEATRSAFYDAFSGAEDALVSFVTTGKLEFSDLVDSIVADLARIAIRQSITGPLASALGQALGGMWGGNGGFSAPQEAVGGYIPTVDVTGDLASGGPARPGSFYQVNEQGPELFTTGGRTYLMSGADGGYVTPVTAGTTSAGPAAPRVEVNVINQTGDRVEAQQQGARFDGEKFVVDVVMRRARKDAAFRRQLQEPA